MQKSKLAEAVNHTLGGFPEQRGTNLGSSPVSGQSGGISFGELAHTVSRLIDEGDKRSRKKLESVFTLSFEQRERAEGLGFPPERILALEHVSSLCISTLKKIIDQERVLPRAIDYMNTIAKSFASDTPLHIEDKDIPKVELDILIALIFSKENIEYGIPYIMPYFLGFLDSSLEDQTINVRLLTGFLDFWRHIGLTHELFGRVPKEYIPEMEVFKCYTAYFDKEWYFTIPLMNQKGNPDSEDYKVIGMDEIPDTFARIGMHDGSQENILLDSAHYETIYVLGGKLYKYLRPAAKGLRNFIIKHQEFLGKPGNAPWQELRTGEERVWQGAKILLKQIQNKTTSQDVSQPSKKSNTRPQKPKPVTALSEGKTTQPLKFVEKEAEDISKVVRVSYPPPIIRESILKDALCMMVQERNIDIVSLSASSFCDNIPEGAALVVWDYNSRTRRGLHSRIYEPGDQIQFDTFFPGETWKFKFRFVPLGTKVTNISGDGLSELSIENPYPVQRIIQPSDMVTEAVKNVQEQVIGPIGILETKTLEETPTEKLALEILETPEQIKISRENLNTLHIYLPGRDDFLLTYTLGKKEFLHIYLPEDVIWTELFELVEGEIQGKVNIYLSEELQHLCLGALALEERQTRIFLSHFPDFGSRDEVLAECRINGYTSGMALSSKVYTSQLQALQSEFSKVSISLGIEKLDKEMRISIGLQSLGKKITILSRDSVPYFSLENEASLSEVEKRLARNIFLLVSIVGKLLVNPPKPQKKTSTKKGNPDTQVLSPEQIRDIIEGKYKPKTFSIRSLSRDDVDRLDATIKRFDDRRGRLFVSGGFSDTYGYYRCHVEGHKGWDLSPDDFIVLTDEKISSVPEGRSGQPYVYDMLQENERLKKYFILKMIATAKSVSAGKSVTFRGKHPFSNGLGDYFRTFWESIPQGVKEEFMNQVATEGRKARNGLSFKYILDGQEVLLFQSFLDGIRESKILLMYSRPQIMLFGELQEYKESLQYSPLKGTSMGES